MCTVLKVSRSGYYKWRHHVPGQQEKRRQKLMKRIQYHFDGYKQRYGSPKIAVKLRGEGWIVSTKTVSRLMKKMGLCSRTVNKYKATTNSNHSLPVFDNLLNQNFQVLAPNCTWVADITHIQTNEGWVYLSSLMDLYSRKIIGWSVGSRMTKELTLEALRMAYERQAPTHPVIHHSDRGSQYASHEYRKQLETYKMIGSMSRKGNCYDNASIESFHSVLKKEMVYHTKFKTRQQAYEALYEYIEIDYNRIRIHSSIGNVSPHQFEKNYFQNHQAS